MEIHNLDLTMAEIYIIKGGLEHLIESDIISNSGNRVAEDLLAKLILIPRTPIEDLKN